MRFALEAASVGIWDMDYAHRRAALVRRSSKAQHGLQPGTFGGTMAAFVERIHPDDRAAVARRPWRRDEVWRRFLHPVPFDAGQTVRCGG